MPLPLPKLQSSLHTYFGAPGRSAGPNAERLAAGFAGYAATALAPGGGVPVPAVLAAKRAALARQLSGALRNRDPGGFVAGITRAFTAFWTGMTFAPGPPGAVSLVPPTLQAALSNIHSANAALARRGVELQPDRLAQQWAKALDAWSRTVVVTHPGAPPVVGPIT